MNARTRIAIAAAACALAAGGAASTASALFTGYIQSPSQNILCALDLGKAWCTVGNLRKEVWISATGSVRVTGRSNADIGDVTITTLAYGTSVRARNITCTSRMDGMLCVSRSTGRGALMNRSGVTRR